MLYDWGGFSAAAPGRFNSLFEMLLHSVAAVYLRQDGHVSILCLRCKKKKEAGGREEGWKKFQFSV